MRRKLDEKVFIFPVQVSLELGGKSPNIVFESADLEQGW